MEAHSLLMGWILLLIIIPLISFIILKIRELLNDMISRLLDRVSNGREIAAASTRVMGLTLGIEDYVADLECTLDPATIHHTARQVVQMGPPNSQNIGMRVLPLRH